MNGEQVDQMINCKARPRSPQAPVSCRRRYSAVVPFAAEIRDCALSTDDVCSFQTPSCLMVGGLHFMIFRMMLPFAWIRVLMGAGWGRYQRFQWNGIDKALLLWALTDTISEYCSGGVGMKSWAGWGFFTMFWAFIFC